MSPTDTPPELHLRTRGPLSIRTAAGDEILGLSRRSQALLAYLVRQPGMRAERGLVADLLWSDRAEEQARASLRQELSVLRRALPDDLVGANRQFVWLDPVRVRVEDDGAGDFLQGFDLPSEGFEDWLRSERSTPPAASDPPAVPAPAAPSRSRPVLAVLPFEELGASGGDMFADGIVEEITGALSRVHDFHVIARQSAFALRGAALDPNEAADRLGADYLIEGTVRRAGDRVRIAVQLVSGRDARTLWSERFDDRMDDLFDLQDRIAAQVAGQIMPNIRTAEIARARTQPPESRSAYELVLTALPHFWAHERTENARALKLLDMALATAPDYGPALAYKAWALGQQPSYMWTDDPLGDRARALDLAQRAAREVTDHAPSLVAIGAAISLISEDLATSNSFVDRALMIDPNNAWGWLRRGWNRNYGDRSEEARACFDRAEALSPLDPFLFNVEFGRGGSFLNEERYEEALVHFEKALSMAPGVKWAYRVVTTINVQLGRMDAAREALGKLRAAYPGLTVKKLAASIPPTIIENQPRYFDALRAAGLPEE